MLRLLLIFIMVLNLFMFSTNINLDFLEKPSKILIKEKTMLIQDQNCKFILLDLNKGTIISKFGRMGEGPREVLSVGSIQMLDNEILINGNNKIMFFRYDGSFVKEYKIIKGFDFVKLGKYYYGLERGIVDKKMALITVKYNKNLKKIKNISKRINSFLGSKYMDPILIYKPLGSEISVFSNMLLVKTGTGSFKIFKENGDYKFQLTPKIEKTHLTQEKQKQIINVYKTETGLKEQYYRVLKNRLKFQNYAPEIRTYFCDYNFLYVIPYRIDGKQEVIVYNRKGKFLYKKNIPLRLYNPLSAYPHCLYKETFYQIIENDDGWELKKFRLKN